MILFADLEVQVQIDLMYTFWIMLKYYWLIINIA